MAQNHKCQICGAEFTSESQLEEHNRTMHSEYKCEDCGETFHSKSDYETHYREAHPERAGSPPR